MVHMLEEYVIAQKVGKGQSVIFLHMIVNPLTALVEDSVWLDNVIAKLDGREQNVMKVLNCFRSCTPFLYCDLSFL